MCWLDVLPCRHLFSLLAVCRCSLALFAHSWMLVSVALCRCCVLGLVVALLPLSLYSSATLCLFSLLVLPLLLLLLDTSMHRAVSASELSTCPSSSRSVVVVLCVSGCFCGLAPLFPISDCFSLRSLSLLLCVWFRRLPSFVS